MPKEIENIIRELNYQATLYGIAREHKLSITQMGSLDTTTTNLIIGVIHPNEFENALKKNLGLPEEIITELVNEITEKIFKKIREKLMALHNTQPKKLETLTQIKDIQVPKKETLPIPDLPAVSSAHPPATLGVAMRAGLPQAGKLELTTIKSEPARVSEEIHPILNQKLSSSFQAPIIKREYGLNNTPEKVGEETPSPQAPKATSYPPKADPYRLNPPD